MTKTKHDPEQGPKRDGPSARWGMIMALTAMLVALASCGTPDEEVSGGSGGENAADSGISSDPDAVADAGPAVGDKCTSHDECAHVGSNTGCAAGRCNNGTCTTVHAPKGKLCQLPGQLVTECQESQCNGLGSCKVIALDDGDSCGDTLCGDACKSGQCKKNSPKDDGNPCTVEYCKGGINGVDSNTNPNVVCSDGDPCTHEDSCVEGQCKGKKQPCDDGVACTIDWCDAEKGCQVLPADGLCADANACVVMGCDKTAGCQVKTFNKGQGCNDGNPCTSGDNCNSLGTCVGSTNDCKCATSADCKSDNKCNPLVCQAGSCVVDKSAAVVCSKDADSLCATNLCDPATGKCVIKPLKQGKECDDGNPCTSKSTCESGACKGSADVKCDDGNTCTLDTCAPEQGCKFIASGAACDDGNVCTVSDVCQGNGVCAGALKSCNDKDPCTVDSCSGADGACTHKKKPDCLGCKAEADCDDGNTCTQDICQQNGQCANLSQPNCVKKCTSAAECNDNQVCTLDGCNNGKCEHKPKPGCTPACKNHSDCDDGIKCTDDTCTKVTSASGEVATKCVHQPAQGCTKCSSVAQCNDNDKCTQDVCNTQAGFCENPVIPGCGNAGGCQNNAACNDNNACTTDKCNAGKCEYAQIICKDTNACTYDSCDEKSGVCKYQPVPNCGKKCGSSQECDDGSKCVTQLCVQGACKAYNQKTCNDNNSCTYDTCDHDSGQCGYAKIAGCDNGKCVTKDDCNDGDACTNDTCSTWSGKCNNYKVPNCTIGKKCSGPADCNDQNGCTSDLCSKGECLSVPISCDDKNPCTNDGCQSFTGACYHSQISGCVAVKCDKASDCNDLNKCTADTCDSGYCKNNFIPNCK